MIDTIVQLLGRITHPRFFLTERGYQGELVAFLHKELDLGVFPGDVLVEQEYQKQAGKHGITRRPDIIIHRPTDEGGDRRKGNYAVFELKLQSTDANARDAFARLDEVVCALDYQLGIFVDINSARTHSQIYNGKFRDRLHFIAVSRTDKEIVVLHEYFEEGELRSAIDKNILQVKRV